MVGRGALGNPYIFEEILAALEQKNYTRPTGEQIFADIQAHITALCELKGEYTGIRESRKHAAWYLKGMPNAAASRDKINRSENLADILNIIEGVCRHASAI